MKRNRLAAGKCHWTKTFTLHGGGGPMKTECTPRSFGFHQVGGREIVGRFNGGHIASDGGGILLAEVEERFRFVEKFATCFTDHRDQKLIEHPLIDLLKQ